MKKWELRLESNRVTIEANISLVKYGCIGLLNNFFYFP